MGIEMCAFMEVKREVEWMMFASFIVLNRDHLLFDTLRGEDEEGNYPTKLKPKGLPKEVSHRVNKEYIFHSDYFDASWLSFQDLRDVYKRYEKRRKKEKEVLNKNYELEGMMGLMERLENCKIETRFVFWFYW